MKLSHSLSQLSRYVLRPSVWDGQTEAEARSIPCDEPGFNVAALRRMVDSGAAKVCTLEREGARLGFVVFTAEPGELMVWAAFGCDRKTNLMDVLIPLVDRLARACECESVRFNTCRPGMIARAQQHGFRVSEVIMRKGSS